MQQLGGIHLLDGAGKVVAMTSSLGRMSFLEHRRCIFTIRQVVEKSWEHTLFYNYKVYESVPLKAL